MKTGAIIRKAGTSVQARDIERINIISDLRLNIQKLVEATPVLTLPRLAPRL